MASVVPAPLNEPLNVFASNPVLSEWSLVDVTKGAGQTNREAILIASKQMTAPTQTSLNLSAEEKNMPMAEAGDCDGICLGIRHHPELTDHASREESKYRGFFKQAGTIPTELLLVAGYYTLQSGSKFTGDTTSFHFHDEGWFGKNTTNAGVDKLAHAYNTYLLAEILHSRLHRNTDGSHGDALTAAILAFGFTAINEVSDAIEPDSGYSMQDVIMNGTGAAFSVLRNTVPGLKEKLSYKIEIIPNSDFYTLSGKEHWSQMRFMLSLKGAGFKKLDNSPLKYLDLQVGYWASDILNSDREAGIEPKRHLFVGVGLNVGELLFGRSRTWFGKAANTTLDYFQLPYTSLRYDTTGRFGSSGSPR